MQLSDALAELNTICCQINRQGLNKQAGRYLYDRLTNEHTANIFLVKNTTDPLFSPQFYYTMWYVDETGNLTLDS